MGKDLFDDNVVNPLTPPAPYLGGKTNLSDRIVNRIQAIPHTTYAEPFLGMGGIFFRRTHLPKAEVVNDINKELVTFFRVIQRHFDAFVQAFEFQHASRAEFDRLKSVDPTTLTDIERAARFYYLQCMAFGGKPANPTFGLSNERPARIRPGQVREKLAEFSARLDSVTIENLQWQEFVRRYDSPKTLFYLDPPYHGGETDYGKGVFAREDFVRMAENLAANKGRFILSINDHPDIRSTFSQFRIEPVETAYSIARDGETGAFELLVSNI